MIYNFCTTNKTKFSLVIGLNVNSLSLSLSLLLFQAFAGSFVFLLCLFLYAFYAVKFTTGRLNCKPKRGGETDVIFSHKMLLIFTKWILR